LATAGGEETVVKDKRAEGVTGRVGFVGDAVGARVGVAVVRKVV
jgi:hypothetical protein